MKSYLVSLKEDKGDKFTMFFECLADDEDHAEEQALNVYPWGQVIHICHSDNPIPLNPIT